VVQFGPLGYYRDRWQEITEAERRKMLQAVLNERFKMTIRHESKELPVYALVVAREGRS